MSRFIINPIENDMNLEKVFKEMKNDLNLSYTDDELEKFQFICDKYNIDVGNKENIYVFIPMRRTFKLIQKALTYKDYDDDTNKRLNEIINDFTLARNKLYQTTVIRYFKHYNTKIAKLFSPEQIELIVNRVIKGELLYLNYNFKLSRICRLRASDFDKILEHFIDNQEIVDLINKTKIIDEELDKQLGMYFRGKLKVDYLDKYRED